MNLQDYKLPRKPSCVPVPSTVQVLPVTDLATKTSLRAPKQSPVESCTERGRSTGPRTDHTLTGSVRHRGTLHRIGQRMGLAQKTSRKQATCTLTSVREKKGEKRNVGVGHEVLKTTGKRPTERREDLRGERRGKLSKISPTNSRSARSHLGNVMKMPRNCPPSPDKQDAAPCLVAL